MAATCFDGMSKPKASQGMVATLVRTIFEQPDHDSVWDQHARVVDQLSGRFDDAAGMLADAAEDLLAFSTFPAECWPGRSGPRERRPGRAFASHTEGDRSTVPLSVTLCKPHPSSGARLDKRR